MKLSNNKILFFLILPQFIYSYNNYFDSITTDPQMTLLDSVVTTFYIEDCCKSTINKCLDLEPGCPITPRLLDFTSWMIINKKDYKKTIEELDKRLESFFGPDTFSFDLPYLSPAGDTAAPLDIIVYISASCPLCKKVCIPLYMAVADGPIKGMATLHLKTMTTGIGDMALLAADSQGKFWEYFLSLEKEDRRLNERILVSKAKKTGLNINEFKAMLYDEKQKARLKGSREEAIKNGVQISPTLFINNRRYRSYKDPQWVIDLVEYEYQK